jgi:hypothetical protein
MAGTGRDVALEETPDGRRLVVARDVAAGRDAAWDLLTDTDLWPDWGPSVRAVECDRRYVEAGTAGRVRLPGGVWLPFEITACAPYRWTWRVARVPATGHRVDPPARGSAADRCRVGFELPVLAAGYAPVCLRALDRLDALLAAEE